jgi:small-conductance mechanosensitive channel/CRP-like cAMP-binding protein
MMRDTPRARLLGAGAALLTLLLPGAAAPEGVPAGAPASAPAEMSLGALAREFTPWKSVALFAGLVAVAVLLNLVNPKRRQQLRKVLLMFAGHALAAGAAKGLLYADSFVWAERAQAAANLLGAFALVHLLAILLFDIMLPRARVTASMLVVDLVIAAGYLISLIAVLSSVGVDASGLLTTSAVVTGIVALSLQKTIGNVLGGVAIQLDSSISVGDWIQIGDGPQGRVAEIGWRRTLVETRNWDTLVIPNATLLDSTITILGKRGGVPVPHRMWVYFTVDFRYQPSRVISAVTEALRSAPITRVAQDPPPNVVCLDFAKERYQSVALYAVRYYLTDLANDDPTSSEIRGRIFSALKRAGIPLAIPAQARFLTKDNKSRSDEKWEEEKKRRLAALEAIDLFNSMSSEELLTIAERLRYAPFTGGETVTKQGQVAHWLYILASGSAEIRVRSHDGREEEVVATITGPTVFGEMALLTGEPRTATVVACNDVECYRLDKEAFQQLLKERQGLAEEISKILVARKVELEAAQKSLDAEAKERAMRAQASQLLGKIQGFFGLS